MGQPKKLTHKQKQERKLDEKLAPVLVDLQSILKKMRAGGDVDLYMCRNEALELFKIVSNSNNFPQNDGKVARYVDACLEVAREAQGAMSFNA